MATFAANFILFCFDSFSFSSRPAKTMSGRHLQRQTSTCSFRTYFFLPLPFIPFPPVSLRPPLPVLASALSLSNFNDPQPGTGNPLISSSSSWSSSSSSSYSKEATFSRGAKAFALSFVIQPREGRKMFLSLEKQHAIVSSRKRY